MRDISGESYGRLTAIKPIGKSKFGQTIWECQCDCGNTHTILIGNWKKEIYSCGCLRSLVKSVECKEIFKSRTIHGYARRGQKSPEYLVYLAAKQRCTNPKVKNYSNYGGRGIKFLLPPFREFIRILGPRPNGYTLERKNNDGHYEIGNVTWDTRSAQVKNRRPRNEWRRANV